MTQDILQLPVPETSGGMSLAQTLRQRRSVRTYQIGELSLAQVGQLLWAAQGITAEEGLRTAPSAGALYPLEIHLAVGLVEGLASGVYHYAPDQHRLTRIQTADVRTALSAAAHHQSWVRDAAVVLACSVVYDRTTGKYGHRGVRYVHMEVGHAAQNVLLQATSLGLHSVIVGAFDDDDVHKALATPANYAPLCLIPIGR